MHTERAQQGEAVEESAWKYLFPPTKKEDSAKKSSFILYSTVKIFHRAEKRVDIVPICSRRYVAA